MVRLKDITTVIHGLSLVANEAIRRSRGQQLKSLIHDGMLSAADVAGLTKGKIHNLEKKMPKVDTTKDENKTSSSVVYFTEESPNIAAPESGDHLTPSVDASHPATDTPLTSIPAIELPGDSSSHTKAAESQPMTTLADPHSDKDTTLISSSVVQKGFMLPQKKRKPMERRVPSTPFSRAMGFAGLGAGIAWGALQESANRIMFGTPSSEQNALSSIMSERNAERLALALCRMRGAALKLGQMLSIQDESLVPAPILAALEIVRQGADQMPKSQLNQVLDAELGSTWSSKLFSFDYEPLAAASIGQVHRAVTKDGLEVAMKIQYPGVADSIESDIDNVKLLLKYTNLVPEKLFVDSAMKVAKEELSRECDYELEAKNQKRFRSLLESKEGFYVPFVVDDLSCRRVLTTELVPGVPIDQVALLDQDTRNYVGRKFLELTLMELFIFRFMQTDPNWSNFLYDQREKNINLIDFGAARDYPKHFVDDYLRMVLACANCDKDAVIEMSRRLGFLTGEESDIMLDAHAQAGFLVGMPFSKSGGYDFGSTNITQGVTNLGSRMLRHRLTPPPEEAYSLHRKLSGAFLACIKLKAIVPCRELLLEVYENHEFGEERGELLSASSTDERLASFS